VSLDAIGGYITEARILLQDQTQPFRYPDSDLIRAFNNGLMDSRRLRPDMWLGFASVPEFYSSVVSANTASGAVIPFTLLSPSVANGMYAFDVTTPNATPMVAAPTVQSIASNTVTLSTNISQQVNQGDTFAFGTALPAIDQQYRTAFVYYICGMISMRDQEETEDSRAAGFMASFKNILTGAL
jgi:hypothetical protein